MIGAIRRPLLASALAYTAVTLVMARDLLPMLSTALIGGAVDPALNAGILAWSAGTIPWTQRWFDFPAFYPATDALTFSEHLLGLSPVASPLYWLTGDAVLSYNLTALATYVLCGVAMFALIWRLTGSAAASFLAGFAFAFAPYRAGQFTHIQVFAVFWAPLALLGLHAYLDSRRKRWLGVFGLCWMMQGAANGYFLVFFSVLVGLWVLWFVVAPRRWRDLGMIAVAGFLASLPLIPILLHFMDAHARYLLMRPLDEVRNFSADVSAVLCPPPLLAMAADYGGLCRPEGELFPGIAVLALCGIAAGVVSQPLRARPRAAWIATAVSMFLLAGALIRLWAGVSAARAGGDLDVRQPFSQGMVLLLLAAACSPALWTAVRRSSVPAFYLLMIPVMWAFTWGPTPLLYGRPALTQGPYAWLMLLPGLDGLRVPGRFWMMAVLCLCVAMGVTVGIVLGRRRQATAWLVAIVGACALALDGWSAVPADVLRPPPPRPDLIRGGVAITLPIGNPVWDVAAQLDAIEGGWIAVNGYSGYEAPHYGVLRYASLHADAAVLSPFVSRGDLHVIVDEHSPRHVALVEQQPGVQLVGAANGLRQYRIPRQGTQPPSEPRGARLRIASVSASCFPDTARLALDGDSTTRWECGPQQPGQAMTADLGAVRHVGQVVPALGMFSTDFPRHLVVETSLDGTTWIAARDGGVLHEAFDALSGDARVARIVLSFTPRPARYVRLRQVGRDDKWYWSIADVEVWGGGPTS